MKPTIRDIATKSGVSIATVSRYFSGSHVVSNEIARKIEEVASELGYIHKGKKSRRSGIIAVLIPHLQYIFFTDVLKELMEQLPKFNYRMVFIPVIPGSEDHKFFFKELAIDGAIYMDEDIDREILNYISSKNIKLVMCGGAAFDSKTEMIHINDMAAAYEGMKYLLSLGHEKILILSDYLKSISCGYQRLMGCKRALDEAGIAYNEEEMVAFGHVTFEMGCKLTKKKLEEKVDFTAIFAFSDEMALGAITALDEKGLRVPADVSVLGFDDISIASKVVPKLSTIHQPINHFVSKTLSSFLELDDERPNMEITLPYEILKRGTCIERKKNDNQAVINR